eukprot:199273-Rhodomonas_salina.1
MMQASATPVSGSEMDVLFRSAAPPGRHVRKSVSARSGIVLHSRYEMPGSDIGHWAASAAAAGGTSEYLPKVYKELYSGMLQ